MAFYIKPHHTRSHYSHADNGDFKLLLGMPTAWSKWPREAIGKVSVKLNDGRWTVMWLEAFEPIPDWNGRKIKSSKHRAMVICPNCAATVPAGRTHQHKCKG